MGLFLTVRCEWFRKPKPPHLPVFPQFLCRTVYSNHTFLHCFFLNYQALWVFGCQGQSFFQQAHFVNKSRQQILEKGTLDEGILNIFDMGLKPKKGEQWQLLSPPIAGKSLQSFWPFSFVFSTCTRDFCQCRSIIQNNHHQWRNEHR